MTGFVVNQPEGGTGDVVAAATVGGVGGTISPMKNVTCDIFPSGPTASTWWTLLPLTTIDAAVARCTTVDPGVDRPAGCAGHDRHFDVTGVLAGSVGRRQDDRRSRAGRRGQVGVATKLAPLSALTDTFPPLSTTWTK